LVVRQLSPRIFEVRAKPILDKLIRTFDIRQRPFHDEVEARDILDIPGFWLDEDQFRAVCDAATAVGDKQLLYTMTRGYLGGPELMPWYTWELSLYEYDEYCDAEDEPPNKEHDFGIPLDRILYSPAGEWVVILPDDLALLGGSLRFMESFRTSYPQWPTQVQRFLDSRLELARKRTVDNSWVPDLLHHLYGDDAPEFVP
jgi:hypothetical protein